MKPNLLYAAGLCYFAYLSAILAIAAVAITSCAKRPNPPGPVFAKVHGQPTASADADRGRGEIPWVTSPKFPVIYFDFDSDKLRAEYPERVAAALASTKAEWVCYVDGHASSEGTDEYNMALGARRASRVGDYIQAFKGITVIETSYGEERPKETPELSRRAEVRCE